MQMILKVLKELAPKLISNARFVPLLYEFVHYTFRHAFTVVLRISKNMNMPVAYFAEAADDYD